MKLFWRLLATVPMVFGSQAGLAQEENPLAELDWIVGPAKVTVAGQASLDIPEGYLYLEPEETVKFQELVENMSNGKESMLAPESLNWFALFEFEDVGFVKDDEEIDAPAILESVSQGTEAANEARRQRGWAEMHVVGWRFEPGYDPATQRLEWAIIGESDGHQAINFNSRLLGRKGVTSAVLVAAPEGLDEAVVAFKQVLTGFEYLPGERYADVQAGDKIAEYGLAALIAGGGAAVAAKTGLLKGLWKFIAAAGAAVVAGLGKLFGGRKQTA